MIIVVDVSAVIEIIFQREKVNRFKSIYNQGSWIIAPDLFIAEITNVLWKYYRAGLIFHMDCLQYVQDGIDMIDDFIKTRELWKEALARRNDATLITNDGALARVCEKLSIEICS